MAKTSKASTPKTTKEDTPILKPKVKLKKQETKEARNKGFGVARK